MNLVEKLEAISRTSTLKKLPTGSANDFEELWTKIIEPNLPAVSVVKKWHELLIEYVKKPDAVFFVRAYGSPSGNSAMLRRGFYNTTDVKFSVVYCDNFLTSYFFSMALDGYVPSITEFEDAIASRTFPCGFIQTSAERKYAAYLSGKDPGIAKKGYKIAHIFSAGEDFNEKSPFISVGSFCNSVFPRGVNTEWNSVKFDPKGMYHYREVKINSKKKEDVRAFAVAHFMRTVHPLNYFLVPKKSTRDKETGVSRTNIIWWDSGVKKDEIGENKELIAYVEAKIKNRYGYLYDEFLSYIYPVKDTIEPNNKVINAEYGIDIWRKHFFVPSGGAAASMGKATKKARKTPEIILNPSNPIIFKEELLKKRQAEITWKYSDGTAHCNHWNASRFSPNSSVRNNIESRPEWRSKDKDGLVEVYVSIVCQATGTL